MGIVANTSNGRGTEDNDQQVNPVRSDGPRSSYKHISDPNKATPDTGKGSKIVTPKKNDNTIKE